MGDRYAIAPSRRGVRAVVHAVRRRIQGLHEVDPWGLDPDVLAALDPLVGARWHVTITGATHVPLEGPMLFVANRGLGLSEPFVLARALYSATGRRLRSAVVADVGPCPVVLRPFGGVLADGAEVRSLLRSGEMVSIFGARSGLRGHRLGRVDPLLLEPAIAMRLPVLPAALRGHELGRRWRVTVGPAIDLGGNLASVVRTLAAAFREL